MLPTPKPPAADDPVAKLVFLREVVGGKPGRKAVVPLLEGVDFEAFLARVRSRLLLPANHAVSLREEDGQTRVDSIERLLEVDEAQTLALVFEQPQGVMTPRAAELPAARRPSASGKSAPTTPAAPVHAVDIRRTSPAGGGVGVADWAESDKYRKKRGLASSLAHLSNERLYALLAGALLGGGGMLYFMLLR